MQYVRMSGKELISDIMIARKAIRIERARKVIKVCFNITKKNY